MFKRLFQIFFVILLLVSCTSKQTVLEGSAKSLYELINKELNKERKYIFFGTTDYKLLSEMIIALQVRYPYSTYARESYLLSGEVAYKRKKYGEAIVEYQAFIENQINHPKVDYATYRIFKSQSKLITDKDKNIQPAKEILGIFELLTEEYKYSEFMPETIEIYEKAKKYILKRAIYIAKFYIKDEKYNSALGRIDNANILIPEKVAQSQEAQYIKTFCLIKTTESTKKTDYIKSYIERFPNSPYISELNDL
ncbi:MAG: outer membrane protein assembly factor BamD [Thermodesulfobacteriota bacterium]